MRRKIAIGLTMFVTLNALQYAGVAFTFWQFPIDFAGMRDVGRAGYAIMVFAYAFCSLGLASDS